MTREAAEATIAAAAPKITVAGVATMGAGWLTLDSLVTIIGVLVAMVGGWATVYFKLRGDRRAEAKRYEEHEEHARRMEFWDQCIAAGGAISPAMAQRAQDLGIALRESDVAKDEES
ncbi:MAG: hypothetical protein BGO13_11805 [Burkholderiales bacterium 66-5]|nr:MAG: hypothetical protein BGO13_11805 [Burkholderiales bacterium 66-5]